MRKIMILLSSLVISACGSCVPIHIRQIERQTKDPLREERERVLSHTVAIQRYVVGIKTEDRKKIPGVYIVGRGTGVVVAVDKKKVESVIVTADHLCRSPNVAYLKKNGLTMEDSVLTDVVTLDGKECLAEIVKENDDLDLCALRVKCVAGEPTQISSELPPRSSRIVNAGTPLGVFSPGMLYVNEGYYCGEFVKGSGALVFSFPATHGLSGSGAFYRGKLVGIILRANEGFEHLSLAVSSIAVDLFVRDVIRRK